MLVQKPQTGKTAALNFADLCPESTVKLVIFLGIVTGNNRGIHWEYKKEGGGKLGTENRSTNRNGYTDKEMDIGNGKSLC